MYNDYGYGQGQGNQGNDYGNKGQYSKDQYSNNNDYSKDNEDDGYYGGQGDHDYGKQYQ